MPEKLTLLTSLTVSRAQALAAYLESTGISCFIQAPASDGQIETAIANVLVRESDSERAQNLLNEFHPVPSGSDKDQSHQQAFPGLFILPVDFTPASEQACYFALELAFKFKARMKLIHTFGIPDYRPFVLEEGDFYQSTLNTQFNEVREQVEKQIAGLELKIKNYAAKHALTEVPVSKTLLHGVPDEITLYSSEMDEASLIIIGISGENSDSFSTAGKIAGRIVDKSTTPVLIIPENNKFTGIEKIKNILYLTSFDESDFPAIQKLIATTRNLNLSIFCLHIERGTIDPWDKIKMNGLKEYFKISYNLNTVHCDLVSSDNMIRTLDEFISRNNIDMIAMIHHKRNALSKLINPGFTQKILFHTQIPLLVFHETTM